MTTDRQVIQGWVYFICESVRDDAFIVQAHQTRGVSLLPDHHFQHISQYTQSGASRVIKHSVSVGACAGVCVGVYAPQKARQALMCFHRRCIVNQVLRYCLLLASSQTTRYGKPTKQ